MSYIFLDESGDLGFNFTKKKTSTVFVVTCLLTENKRPIEKIVKKTHSELQRKHKRKISVLHCVREKPLTRRRLLKRLNEQNCSIVTIYLNKQKVYTRLQNEKDILYNYVANILLDRVYSKRLLPVKGKISLIASRRETNKFLNENFKNYLNTQVKNRHKIEFDIAIKTSSEEKALQAVDFANWAIFRKYERGDASYYRLFKSKIVEENSLFS